MTLEDIMGGDVPAYLTVKQVAKIFQQDASTVRRDCEKNGVRQRLGEKRMTRKSFTNILDVRNKRNFTGRNGKNMRLKNK